MLLYTQDYIELNRAMHRQNSRYGANGGKNAQLVKELIYDMGITSILDYGCGKGGLEKALNGLVPFQGYDPALTSGELVPAELVTCTDVMEHIEPDCVDAVLAHLFSLCTSMALFVISCEQGTRVLPNSQYAHCSVHSAAWWNDRLAPYGTVLGMPQVERGVKEAVFLVKL